MHALMHIQILFISVFKKSSLAVVTFFIDNLQGRQGVAVRLAMPLWVRMPWLLLPPDQAKGRK